MLHQSDRAYHRVRAEKERALAAQATDLAIRKIHTEMAERYEMLAAGKRAPAIAEANRLTPG